MGIRLSKAPAPEAADPQLCQADTDPSPLLQLPKDVLQHLLDEVTDPEQLQQLSLVCRRLRVAVRHLHPITLKLPVTNEQQAAKQLCALPAECKRLRIQGGSADIEDLLYRCVHTHIHTACIHTHTHTHTLSEQQAAVTVVVVRRSLCVMCVCVCVYVCVQRMR